jgi:hypothetical protein
MWRLLDLTNLFSIPFPFSSPIQVLGGICASPYRLHLASRAFVIFHFDSTIVMRIKDFEMSGFYGIGKNTTNKIGNSSIPRREVSDYGGR